MREYTATKVLGYRIAIEFNAGAVSVETGLPLQDVYEINKRGTDTIPIRNPEPSYYWTYHKIKKIQQELEQATKQKVATSKEEAQSLIQENVRQKLKPTPTNEELIVNIAGRNDKYHRNVKDSKTGYLMKNVRIRGIRKDKTQTRYVSANAVSIGRYKGDRSSGYWLIDTRQGELFPELVITYNLYDPKTYKAYDASPFTKMTPILSRLARDYLQYTKNVILTGNRLAKLADSTLFYRKYKAKKLGAELTDKPLYFTGTLYRNMICSIYKDDNKLASVGS